MLKFLKFIIFAELFCSAGTALYLMTLPNPDAVSIIGLGLLSILGLPIYFSSGIFEDKGRPSRHIGFILFFCRPVRVSHLREIHLASSILGAFFNRMSFLLP